MELDCKIVVCQFKQAISTSLQAMQVEMAKSSWPQQKQILMGA